MISFSAQTILDSMDGVAYVVDLSGRIVAYGRKRWDLFAERNGAPELIERDRVVGRQWSDFVAGQEVQESYRRYIDALHRDPTEPVTFSFRCDGPAIRRDLHMSITALHHSDNIEGFLFHSVTLFEDHRPPLNIFDYKSLKAALEIDSRKPIIAICSYCLKLRRPDDDAGNIHAWMEAEDYYRGGGSSEVRLSHGICPDCYKNRVMSNLTKSAVNE